MNCVLDVRDGTHDSPKYYNEGIPFVTSKNLKNGTIDFSTCKLISKEDSLKYNERSRVDDYDILFAMIGTIGNPTIVKKDRDFSIKNVALFKNISRDLLSENWVKCVLECVTSKMKSDAQGGLQPFVSLDFLRNYIMPLPPISEQKRILSTINKMNICVQNINSDFNSLITYVNFAKRKILDGVFGENSSYKSYYENKISITNDIEILDNLFDFARPAVMAVIVFIFFASTMMIYMTAMRGELVIIIFVIAVLFCIKKNVNIRKMITVLFPLVTFVAFFPIYRKYSLYGGIFIYDQMDISTYPTFWFLTPFYQTLADSIRVFDVVTEMYPTHYSFGIFSYSLLSQIPFVDIGSDVSSAIADYTNSHFYSGLTSTYLGPIYADGGLFLSVIYTFVIALWCRYVYSKFVKKKDYMWTILYAFMFFHSLMLCYGNTIIELSFVFYYSVIYIFCRTVIKRGTKYELCTSVNSNIK